MKWDLTINAPTIISFLLVMVPLIYRAGMLIAEMRSHREAQKDKWDTEHEWRLAHEASDNKHFDRLYELVRELGKK